MGAQTTVEVVGPAAGAGPLKRAPWAAWAVHPAEARGLPLLEKYRQLWKARRKSLLLCPFSRVPLVLPVVRS